MYRYCKRSILYFLAISTTILNYTSFPILRQNSNKVPTIEISLDLRIEKVAKKEIEARLLAVTRLYGYNDATTEFKFFVEGHRLSALKITTYNCSIIYTAVYV